MKEYNSIESVTEQQHLVFKVVGRIDRRKREMDLNNMLSHALGCSAMRCDAMRY